MGGGGCIIVLQWIPSFMEIGWMVLKSNLEHMLWYYIIVMVRLTSPVVIGGHKGFLTNPRLVERLHHYVFLQHFSPYVVTQMQQNRQNSRKCNEVTF